MAKTPQFYNNLSDSEKRYVQVASVFFPLLLIIVLLISYSKSIKEVERTVDGYKDSLKLISVAGPNYMAQQQSQNESTNHKKLDDETLKNNTIKLTSFVAGIANSIDLSVSSYDENDVPYDTGSSTPGAKGKIVIERTLSFDVSDADLSKIMDLMRQIEDSPQPVYVKHYTISKYGSQPGIVRAKIVVATFLSSDKDKEKAS